MRRASIVALLITLSIASIASAQEIDVTTVPVAIESRGIAKRWRVHAEVSPLHARGSRSVSLWEDLAERQARNTARPLGAAPTVGLGLGYSVSRYVVFGLMFAGGYEQITPSSEGASATTLSSWLIDIAPYAEVVFGSHVWRPFVGVSVLTRYESQTQQWQHTEQIARGTDRLSTDYTWWGGSVSSGVHTFVSDALSLDLGLRGRVLLAADEGFLELSLQLGLSGWL